MNNNQHFKECLLLILLSTIIISCTSNDSTYLQVELNNSINKEVAFKKNYTTYQSNTFYKKYPKFNDAMRSKFGIDSSDILSTLTLNTRRFEYELYLNGFINDSIYKVLEIDSIEEKKKPGNTARFLKTYFKDSKQYIVFDSNENFDFSDDSPQEFHENFRLKSDIERVKNLPNHNLNYATLYKDKIYHHNRKVVVFPHSNYWYLGGLDKDSIINKSRIIYKFKDYWKGEIDYKNYKYDIAIQGLRPHHLSVLIKPDSLEFDKSESINNEIFSYKVKDSIHLSNDTFIIDSIPENLNSIYFKKVIDKDYLYGKKPGDRALNYSFLNLKNDKSENLYSHNNKQYILLDFWGTWCGPCKKLTPKLKEMNYEYSDKLIILGIAKDKNKELVINYVESNKMEWSQYFISQKDRLNPIIKGLDITAYPTFILLDKDFNILKRGIGKPAIEEIEKTLKND